MYRTFVMNHGPVRILDGPGIGPLNQDPDKHTRSPEALADFGNMCFQEGVKVGALGVSLLARVMASQRFPNPDLQERLKLLDDVDKYLKDMNHV